MGKSFSLNIPGDVINSQFDNPFIKNLAVTKIGYFDKAYNHFIHRDGICEYVMLYCVDGKGFVKISGEEKDIYKGDIVFCELNMPHDYGADNIDPWSIYWLHFVGNGVCDLLNTLEISPKSPILHIGVQSNLISLINNTYKILSDGYSFSNLLYASTLIQEFFCYLINITIKHSLNDTSPIDMEKLIAFMHQNITKNYTVDEFAAYLNISKYHFTRKFKQSIGYPPMEYFNRIKIQKACELFDISSQNIKEISDFLGFNNPYYFSEVFKKITSLSPKEYRKLYKNLK